MKSFPIGGVHPPENKISSSSAIASVPTPSVVIIALSQHIGVPANAIVKKGDRVLAGQLIGEANGFMSANVHTSVSGVVKSVDMVINASGIAQPMVTITSDPEQVWCESIITPTQIIKECTLEPTEILARIKEAGVVGMGGATFPTHVKLSVPPGKKAEFLVINGVECEPYLTSDHRTMLERSEEIMVGVEILMRAIGVQRAYIGIENNKPDAIEKLTSLASKSKGIEVVPLKVQYPQGGEKQLIAAVSGREVPPPPALPIDVGAVVSNISTAVAVYEAVQLRKPLVERVVTITGKSLSKPCNILAKVGTPISELIDAAGGVPENTGKVINGGPMMGRAMVNLNAPVTKGCSGITILAEEESKRSEVSPCIKCAKCVSVCPMALEPFMLSKLGQRGAWESMEAECVTHCIECGSCQFSCPANIALLDYIRLGKQRVMALIRARAVAK